ncbi:putative ribonuclease H-like domain-containing protein [Tanacetum coccineum]
MNKADIEIMSIDDLYNNFKIVEQNVKKSVCASSGAQNLAFLTTPSTSSTNDVNTANPAYEVSIVSPNINTACPQVSTANFSDNTVYYFIVENPNGSNLLQQDLEQIHEDDLEAIDLKWQLSLLSIRAKWYFQRTGKKIFINANDTVGYDKSKVECFNCHKMVHFARECRAPRNKEGEFKYQDNTRKQGNNEDTSLKAMLAIDCIGFDWSDMAEEQVQTNMALMAFSNFKLNQTEFTAATYKRGLATVEEQLITYRKNEVLFSEEVAVLKREVACKDYEINVLKSEFEKVKQEKEGIEFKIEKFDNASKSLNKLLESQITDKSKKGLGYNVVPPPHPLIYNRPKKLDLSYSGLDEFKDPEFKSYGSEDKQVSEDTSSFVESSLNVDKETVFLVDKKVEFVKPKNHEKPVKKSVRLIANTIKGKGWFTHKVFTAKAQAVNICLGQKHLKLLANSAVVIAVRASNKQVTPGFVDSGCSRHMTGNITYLLDFKEFDRGYVTFRGGVHGVEFLGTITNESAGIQGELNAGTSTEKEEISQDCIDVDNGEPKSAADDQKPVEDGPDNENDEKDKYEDDSSPKEVNTARQHVNTASPEVNTGRFKLNTVDPSVNTASSYDQDSPKDMFTMGASHTLEATHVEFFSDEDEPEVVLGNITNSYIVPTTPNTIIHKDHPIENVIGDVKSSVQTRRMTKPTSEQGFLSLVNCSQVIFIKRLRSTYTLVLV